MWGILRKSTALLKTFPTYWLEASGCSARDLHFTSVNTRHSHTGRVYRQPALSLYRRPKPHKFLPLRHHFLCLPLTFTLLALWLFAGPSSSPHFINPPSLLVLRYSGVCHVTVVVLILTILYASLVKFQPSTLCLGPQYSPLSSLIHGSEMLL